MPWPFFISMPVKIAKRGDKFCVIEPDDSVVKCHPTREEAMKHAVAININTKKTKLLFYKDHKGVWNWLGIVSNNRMDREEDIITSDSHKKFVQNIDDGTYKEAFGKDTPDLWVWHVPVPVGYAETVAYDERGFLIAAGKGHEGEFYDKVFEGLVKHEEDTPGSMGMSHGMPWDYLEMEKSDPHLITGYMSEEFTFLPLENAANFGTAMGGIMVKSMPLEIEDYKRDWFIDTFGEDTVAQFDARLSEIGKAADEADVPKKEIAMTNSTKKKKKEDVVEDALAEEEVEESDVEEEATPDIEDKQEEEDDEEEEEKQEDEEDEEEEEKQEDEEEEEDEDEEKQFATLSDLEEVVQEVIKGVTEPFTAVNASITEMREEISELRKELNALKQTEDERVTAIAKDTPVASLSAIIARTIEGQPKARLSDEKDNKLQNSGPEETEHTMSGTGMTGINSIDELISKQRGRNRIISAQGNGQ